MVHGAEDAREYESGSMTALEHERGTEEARGHFTSQLLRGSNRGYMLQKWGALKPGDSSRPEERWARPFNRDLPVSWWVLDEVRRHCIREPVDEDRLAAVARSSLAYERPPCPFDEGLAESAAQAHGNGGAAGDFARAGVSRSNRRHWKSRLSRQSEVRVREEL